jgi:hypothetical protein
LEGIVSLFSLGQCFLGFGSQFFLPCLPPHLAGRRLYSSIKIHFFKRTAMEVS